MTEQAVNVESAMSGGQDATRRLHRTLLIVPAIALLGGAVGMMVDARIGLFAAAFVLGWTQLVGL